MAPSASMLFLSYHQLHRPATEPEPAPPRREEAAAGGGFRMSVSSVFSLGFLERRPEGKTAAVRGRGAGGEAKASAAADASKELESKFEEALRLSCWSS